MKKCLWCCLLGVAIALPAFLYDRCLVWYWQSRADMDIEFVITDDQNGQPIEAAQIAVDTYEALVDHLNKTPFDLVTDQNGMARRVCECRSHGCRSNLGFTNTYSVQPPFWRYQVSAPGYRTSERVDLYTDEIFGRIQRLDGGHAKLVIPVALQKKGERQ